MVLCQSIIFNGVFKMDLKSLFKFSLVCALTTAPIAHAQPCNPCNFNGFSLGLGLGASTFMNNLTLNTDGSSDLFVPIIPIGLASTLTATVGNTVSLHENPNLYKYGPMGTLFVGYG